MRHHLIIILLFAIHIGSSCYASDLKFDSYDVSMGLSGSTVTCIYKDGNNLQWIGTNHGIDLFTGSAFIPLRNFISDSLETSNTYITCITEFKGALWAGSWGNGLFQNSLKTGKFEQYKEGNSLSPKNISNNYINCLLQYDDQLWIGTNYCLSQTKGDNVFTHYTFEEVLTKGIPDIKAVIPKDELLLSVFTNSGEILELNTQTGSYKKVAEINFPIQHITKVIKDENNRYWIGTEYSGLVVLDHNYEAIATKAQVFNELNNSHISDICSHEQHGIFVSSDGKGLYIVNPKDFTFKTINKASDHKYTLKSNQLESTLMDNEGVLWIGYFKGGFSKTLYTGDGITHHYKSNSALNLLPNKNVNAIVKDIDENIWIGTENGVVLTDKNLRFKPLSNFQLLVSKKLINTPITSLTCNNNRNQIYIGTYNNGLFIIDLKPSRISQINKSNSSIESNFIRDVKNLNDSISYIATIDGGLYRYKNNQLEKIKVYFKSNYEIQDFFHISLLDNDHLWLSSAGKGPIKINTQTGSGKLYESLSSTISHSSLITSDSSLYVATNKGLFLLNDDEKDFSCVTPQHTHISFYGIIEDKAKLLWLSTSNGIYRYKPETQSLIKINSFNLQGQEFLPGAHSKIDSSTLIFGGTNGLNCIQPDMIVTDTSKVDLFISELKIYGTPFKPGNRHNDKFKLDKQINYLNSITIPSDIDLFSIVVNPIDYKNPENSKIAYTINDGKNISSFIYFNGEISFVKLKAGKYKLNIHSLDLENNEPDINNFRQLLIIKEKPWWQSYWTYIVIITFAACIVIILSIVRAKEYRKTKRLLQKKVTERTASLLSQKNQLQNKTKELESILKENRKLESFKESIISMIVHDLKNPLNGIIGLSSLNEAEHLEHINSASRQMLYLVENILDVRRHESTGLQLFYQQCNIRQLSNEAINEIRFLLKNNEIELINLTTPQQVEVDKDILRRVYINLLTNAIKYSRLNGKITLRSILKDETSEKTLLLSVQDEGQGIKAENLYSIFDLYQQFDSKKSGQTYSNGIGLSFCKIALKAHKGNIWVKSEQGKGSTFYFSIPIQKP